MKQLNEVGIESDRLNKHGVPQYNCVKNLKIFLPASKSSGSLLTFCHPCNCHPCYSSTIAKMTRYVKYKSWLCLTIYNSFN